MDRPTPWWLRAILLLVAAQAMLLLAVFYQATLVSLLVPWPASPLNSRFIASLYTSLGIGVFLCSFSRTFREVRIVLFGIGLATGMLFILTLLRMFFYPGELDRFPYIWMLFYIVDPLLVIFSFWRLGAKDTAAQITNSLAPLWIVQAVIFGSIGLVLLLVPGVGIAFWPWKMTEPLSQLYSAFFLTLAVGNAMAVRESYWEGIRWLTFILALLGLLVLVVSVVDVQNFKPGISTVTWFAFFGIEALVFSGLFLVGRRVRPSLKGVPA
jgi:hypothetical protein